MESEDERQFFYLARIATWSFEERTGPEFSAEGRSEYTLEEIPLTVEGLDGIDLEPEEIGHVLRGAIGAGGFGQRLRSSCSRTTGAEAGLV
ncbi:hypothetical protein ACFVZN_29395 [Streptomyces virginiae]|uniref:hypothetical protein n=1 Tax=Streptomyces virginiae TaxID=1961 RepID=UPI0036801FD5